MYLATSPLMGDHLNFVPLDRAGAAHFFDEGLECGPEDPESSGTRGAGPGKSPAHSPRASEEEDQEEDQGADDQYADPNGL